MSMPSFTAPGNAFSKDRLRKALTVALLAFASCAEVVSGGPQDMPPPTPNVDFALTLQRSGDGSGRILSSPAGIDCGTGCTARFSPGTMVTLTVEAAVGSLFVGWTGACTGTERTCRITVQNNAAVTAAFTAPPRLCTPIQTNTGTSPGDEICWESPRPTGSTLRDVRVLGPSDVWAVDLAGQLLHYDGQRWSLSMVPTQRRLRALASGGGQDLWAVGDSGTVLHLLGGSWQSVPSGTIQNLLGVWVAPTGRLWVVGTQGVARYFDGGQWTDTNPGVGAAFLYAVSGAGTGPVWAVTDSGLVVRWNGTAWSRVSSTATDLRSVWVAPSGTAYFVGSRGQLFSASTAATMLQAVNLAGDVGGQVSDDFNDVFGIDDTEVWVAGARSYHLTAGRWRREDAVAQPMLAVHGSAPGEVWLVGVRGTVSRWNGGSIATLGLDTLGLQGGLAWGPVTARSPSGVWFAAPSNGSVSLGRFDGNHFSVVVPGDVNLRWPAPTSITATLDDHVYIAGGTSSLLHFDGKQLTEVPAATRALSAVWASSAQDVWAVGSQGNIVHFDGTTWSAVSTPSTADLKAVWGSSPTNVWIVGGNDTYRFDGTLWRRDASAPKNGILVSGTSAADVWVVADGSPRTIWHLDSTGWQQIPSGVIQPVGIWASGPSDLWIVERGIGTSPSLVYRWDGTAMQLAATVGAALAGVAGSGPRQVWLTSDAGVLSYRR